MAAKQTDEVLINLGQNPKAADAAMQQPAHSATPSGRHSTTVSDELFSSRTASSALELALEELLSTIDEAVDVRQTAGASARLLQTHIVALKEDVDLVTTFEPPDDEMRARITHAVLQARKLRRLLERDIISREGDVKQPSRGESSSVQVLQIDAPRSTGLKLTPLKLPTFHGDATQFNVYREFFEENILNSEQLTDTAKWLRLIESLTGPPAELISELPRTSQTLHIAWNLLVDTFSASDRPVAALYEKLQQMPQATMVTASLKMTHSKLEGIVMTLEHLGQGVGQSGYVRWLYMNKFPPEVAYQIHQKKDTPLEQLRLAIADFIRAREGADQQAGRDVFVAPVPAPRKVNITAKPAVAESIATKKSSGPTVRVCTFCSADHWNDTCTTYTTIEMRKQKLAGRCFKCLRRAHENECVNPRRCFHCDSLEHNRALCPVKFGSTAAVTNALAQRAIVDGETNRASTGYFLAFVAQASAPSTEKVLEVRVVVDTGGGSTIVRREIANQLQITVERNSATAFTGLGGTQLAKSYPLRAPINLHSESGSMVEINAEAVDWIIPDVPTANIQEFREKYPQFKETYIPPTGHGKPIDILIGSDMMVELLLPQPIQRVDEDMLLMPTIFGALIVGRTREKADKICTNLLFAGNENPLNRMCTLDLVGLANLHNNEIEEENKAIQKFYDTVRYANQRYSISWPWKCDPPNLDVDFGLALGRLKTLHRKLTNSPELLLSYHSVIQKQLDGGIVEAVDRHAPPTHVVHYVPHHPVLQPGKEVRPVYDGSSKTGKAKKSLNDNILKGKNWLNDLVRTLLRFRRYPHAVTSDIAKAFHQIAVNETDRDAVRFIWLKNPLQPPTDNNLQIYRFTRVAFGIVASPFILSATIQFHAKGQEQNAFLDTILADMYADNLVTSLPDSTSLTRFYSYAKNFFGTMSMNLTKWSSNNMDLRKHIPESDQLTDIVQPVLGLRWNIQTDTLQLKNPKNYGASPLTRRIVAREMASHFDPMGWAAPVLLLAKIFFRKVWTQTAKWDEILNAAQKLEWQEITEKLAQITSIKLPRKFGELSGEARLELHTFVDASAAAYAIVSYLRIQQDQQTQLTLIAAKSRLTPLKATTIPKLELIAILLGYRYTQFVKEALQFPQLTTFIWSDSRCALSWMKQEKILPTIIEKYITEAKTYQIDHLRYVPSERNYADVATRGADLHTLQRMEWWKGPEWLYQEEAWPAPEEPVIDQVTLLVFQNTLTLKKEPVSEENSIGVGTLRIAQFSNLNSLLKRTAHILKATVRMLKKNFLNLQETIDTATALRLWLKWDQDRQYALQQEEMAGKPFLLRNINVFRDEEGIIRCQTRLQNSFLGLDATTPILLVQNSTLTKLIVLQIHQQQMHAGTNHTLATLRQRYWLPHGRRQIYKIIVNECFICRKHRIQTYAPPPPAPLPEFRVLRSQRPFQATGIDIFGPFTVRQNVITGSTKEKRWTLIFTCATVRAVHLEVISEMTTIEISYAFRRFFARRGVPRKIISDNAPQFHALDGHFRNLWRAVAAAPSVSNYFAENQIIWEFTPEFAPWMGGIYERLIQSIKKAFERTYADKILTAKQFELAMIETEAVINSRPIAYIDRDPDCPILTPNDFLSAKFSAIPIQQATDETDDLMARLWKSSQTYLDQFWNFWSTQYLMILRERNDQLRRKRGQTTSAPVKGEIVIMQDLSRKRSAWQLAVVERMIPSKDGQIRAVQIRIPNGSRLIRPIVALAPLGISMDLPTVKDDQLTKRKDAIVIWPIDDINETEPSQMRVNTNTQVNEVTPPPARRPRADDVAENAVESQVQQRGMPDPSLPAPGECRGYDHDSPQGQR